MGKVRIAQTLARAGLHLGATTVSRFLKDKESIPDYEIEVETEVVRVVTARHTGHVWHIDFTAAPTLAGFWVLWSPNALTQRWPFCWWVGVIVDHFSRTVVGFAVFTSKPSSQQTQKLLDRAIGAAGKAPKYLICDKDSAFWCPSFKQWCLRRVIRPRFGKVAQHGSVAIVERFIKSLKYEYTHLILVPLRLQDMRRELSLYMSWFNEFRSHRALGGATPREVYEGEKPANTIPRVEPRERWRKQSRCAEPQAAISGKSSVKLPLSVGFLEGRKHLPIVALKKVA